MAYKHNFIKVTALGKLGQSEEIFSFGFHFSLSNRGLTQQEWEALGNVMNDVADEVATFYSTPGNTIPDQWALTSTKAALIGTDGKYEPFAYPEEVIYETPVQGSNSFGTAPQLSAVITLISSKPRDPGKYNRFYVPIAATQNFNYTLFTETQQSLANTAQVMLNNIADIFDAVVPGIRASVVSAAGSGSDLASGTVRVGNIIDTQRRRRNKLQETYVNANLV